MKEKHISIIKEKKELVNTFFQTGIMKSLYDGVCEDTNETCLFHEVGIVHKYNELPDEFYVDDLSKKEYLDIRKKNYQKEELEINSDKKDRIAPLGIYDPINDKIVLDYNAIGLCSEKYTFDFQFLRRLVLFHEIGHRLTRFGSEIKGIYWINNLYYQELIAQLIAYHCLEEDDKKFMKKFSLDLPEEYQTYLNESFKTFRKNSQEVFRLILSVNEKDFYSIKSIKDFISKINAIKLISNKDLKTLHLASL